MRSGLAAAIVGAAVCAAVAGAATFPSSNTPRWSSDGTKIAFESDLGGSGTASYVVNADGSDLHPRTSADGDFGDHGFTTGPATSPSGSWTVQIVNGRARLADGEPRLNEPAESLAWRADGYGGFESLLFTKRLCWVAKQRNLRSCGIRLLEASPANSWKAPVVGFFQSHDVSDFQVAPAGSRLAWTERVGPPGASASVIFVDGVPVTPSPCAHAALPNGGRCLDWSDGAHSYNGGPKRDLVFTGMGGSLVDTGSGWDYVYGGYGPNEIHTGAGNDVIVGGASNDLIWAGPGNDVIDPGEWIDRVDAGPGDDVIHAVDGFHDRIKCGPGRDVVWANAGTEPDHLIGCEVVYLFKLEPPPG